MPRRRKYVNVKTGEEFSHEPIFKEVEQVKTGENKIVSKSPLPPLEDSLESALKHTSSIVQELIYIFSFCLASVFCFASLFVFEKQFTFQNYMELTIALSLLAIAAKQ